MKNWEAVKGRLGEWVNGYSSAQPIEQHRADIRAVLERVEESERLRWLGEHWPAYWVVSQNWKDAEKYTAAIAALAPEVKP